GKSFGLRRLVLAEGKGHFVPSPEAEDDYRRYLREKGYGPEAWQTWELEQYRRQGWVTSPLPEEDYIDTFVATRAVEYLARVQEPFFCWVSFSTPHTPLDPPRPYDTFYDPAALPLPHRREGELEQKPQRWVDQLARTVHALPPTSTDPSLPGGVENAYRRFPLDKTQRMRAAYYGEVSHADAQVGRLLEVLAERGLDENTLVIFTSDHGDYCGDHWAFYKYGGLYDSIIRVPLVLRWPAGLGDLSLRSAPARSQAAANRGTSSPGAGKGLAVEELVSIMDLAPTLLEAAGVEGPPMDGRSLLPLVAGQVDDWRRELVVEGGPAQALITPEWKYIAWRGGTEELYDRLADPHDLYNLGSDPALEQRRHALRERLDACLRDTGGG
ncbi:MAG: sulfatase-like hydrolase/transferase, partial [Armatimonadetes bacterium]|nr:sulfatase-like hydrolase/transferase [Armatimonadota bacterium]